MIYILISKKREKRTASIPKESRRKKTVENIAFRKQIYNRKKLTVKCWLFEVNNKFNKPLTGLLKKNKRKHKLPLSQLKKHHYMSDRY